MKQLKKNCPRISYLKKHKKVLDDRPLKEYMIKDDSRILEEREWYIYIKNWK